MDKVKNKLWVIPNMEAVIGMHLATAKESSGKAVKKFKTRDAALAAYRRGEIAVNDPVEVEEAQRK